LVLLLNKVGCTGKPALIGKFAIRFGARIQLYSNDRLIPSFPFFTVGGSVRLDEMHQQRDEDGTIIGPIDVTREHQQWRSHVYHRVHNTAVQLAQVQAHQIEHMAKLHQRMVRLEGICRSIQLAPARRVGAAQHTVRAPTGFTLDLRDVQDGDPNQGQDMRPATLYSNPKMLSVLWDEYVNGIGGRKPAKDFTDDQRGRVSAKYSQRKVFWDCMTRLLAHGLTKESAFQRLESIYPGSLTNKLTALRRDENRGGHNRLFPFERARPRRRGRNSAPNIRRRR
jgi:hypothetical protein